MNHFRTLVRNDMRVLYRTGYVAATLAVLALLLLIASQAARLNFGDFANVVAAIILFDTVLSPVLLIGLMMLLERGEGSFIALATTPLSRATFVAARTVTVSLICSMEMLLLVLIAYDAKLSPEMLVAGLLGVAAIASLIAFVAVVPFDAIYPFVLPMIVWILLLGASGYGVLLGWDLLWLAWHPTAPSMALLEGAFAPLSAGRIAYGLIGTAVWLALGATLANRALLQMQLRAAGG